VRARRATGDRPTGDGAAGNSGGGNSADSISGSDVSGAGGAGSGNSGGSGTDGGPRILYLSGDPVAGVVPFVRHRLPARALAGYSHVLLRDEPDGVPPAGPAPVGPILRFESLYGPTRTSLRRVSVTGHRDVGHGREVVAGLLGEPIRLDRPIADLRVDLIRGPVPAAPPDGHTPHPLYELVERPGLTWADLVIPDELLARLRRDLKAIERRDVLRSWGVDEVRGLAGRLGLALNLTGPSGSGKSLAARVIAAELRRPLLIVDYAQLESKYVGDTGKHVAAVFAAARQHAGVLFFDEADALLGRRVSNLQQSYDTALNVTRSVLLMQLQSYDGLVLFASNLPGNYDPAFRRRIADHLEFPMPDAAARAAILAGHTPARLPGRSGLDFGALGAASAGLSGGELAGVVYQACLHTLDRWPDATVRQGDFTAAIDAARAAQRLIPDRPVTPAGSGTAGSGPAGSGPAGSGPAGSGPAGSGSAGSGSAGSGPVGSADGRELLLDQLDRPTQRAGAG
jgi:hypothetical protein